MRGWIGTCLAGIFAALGLIALAQAWPLWLISTVWALCLGCTYYVLAGMAVVAIFVRAILAFLPIGAATGAIIYAVLANDWLGLDTLEKRALVAAIVVAAGWVVTFVTGEMRETNQEQERRRDTIRAALVEIQQIIAATDSTDWDQVEQDTRDAFHKDRRYSVFVMYRQQFSVLKRLVEQIEILHKEQIERVMALYQLLDRLADVEERMASDAFKDLAWHRRQDAVLKYIQLQKKVPGAAKKAETALKDAPFWGVLRRLK